MMLLCWWMWVIPSRLYIKVYIKENLTNERFFQYKWFFDISELTVGHGYMGCHVKLSLTRLSHFCSSSKTNNNYPFPHILDPRYKRDTTNNKMVQECICKLHQRGYDSTRGEEERGAMGDQILTSMCQHYKSPKIMSCSLNKPII